MSISLLKFYDFLILSESFFRNTEFLLTENTNKHQNSKTHILPFIMNTHFQTPKSAVYQIIFHNYHAMSTGIISKCCILSRVSI